MSLPHLTQPVYSAGAKLDDASAAFILLHGRGATADDILSLSSYLDFPQVAYLAPQAEAIPGIQIGSSFPLKRMNHIFRQPYQGSTRSLKK